MDSCRPMKKIIFFVTLLTVLFLVVGAGCSKQKETEKAEADKGVIDVVKEGSEEIIKNPEEGRILVDRVRYAQAGNPPFDFTNVIFHQKSGNGYRAEINSEKEIKVEVMTDKDCLLKAQGDKYTMIKEEKGNEIVIVGERLEGENRNLCIGATASGNGQVEIKFKVVELV